MKKTALFASAMVLGTGALSASAQTTYQGSDTLEVVATAVTAACGETPPLTYLGGGSGTGEAAMQSGTQKIAPMSRAMKTAVTAGHNACQLYIADDAIAIVTKNDASCGNLTNAQAQLKLLYFGQTTGDGTTDTVVNGVPSGCSGSARAALINNWNNIFPCSGSSCTGALRHAFRRDDTSGTTDTLRAQLGISTNFNPPAPAAGGVYVVPFCNGDDVGALPANQPGYSAGRLNQDLDPIRTSCAPGGGAAQLAEDVCGPIPYWHSNQFAQIPEGAGNTLIANPYNFAVRSLGVVLTAEVPTAFSASGQSVTASAGDLYAPVACASGTFKLAPNPSPVTSGVTQICPDGSTPIGGSSNLCYAPVTAAGSFECTSNPAPSPTAVAKANFDGRTFNTTLRAADGSIRLVPPAGSLTTTRRVTTAFYRLHALGGASGAGRGCNTQLDTTHLFGCFPEADACTLAYAGYDATKLPGDVVNTTVQAVQLDGQQPLQAGSSPPLVNQNYLLKRKLWINALDCTDAVTGQPIPVGGATTDAVTTGSTQYDTLYQCYRDNGTQQALAAGFFTPAAGNAAPAIQRAP